MKPTREQIEALIRILATAEGIDPDICIRQCQQESAFLVDAMNKKSGAYGLFQLMPATAKDEKVDLRRWHENVFGGVRYLGKMLRMFGTIEKALAAYNWGPGNMQKCLTANPVEWLSKTPDETRSYVIKIMQWSKA